MGQTEWVVPLTETTLDEEEVEAAVGVVRSKWLTMGEQVRAFEEEFARAVGGSWAIAVANGTVALMMAYSGVGLNSGDEVCLPSLTFVATMHAALALGGRPVLIDVASEEDLTMSADDLERKISPRTKLVVTLPYGGFIPDMERIAKISASRGAPVVEDACHAPLAEWNGRRAGTWGHAATWSFYGNKNMTTGEGGMITTDDGSLAEHMRLVRSHGMSSLTWDRRHVEWTGTYDVKLVGSNYRLDEIRAAIGRVQLRKLPAANERRRQAAVQLRKALAPAQERGLVIPFAEPRGTSAHHLFVAIVPERTSRSTFRAFLHERGVQTSVHYPPMHRFPHVRHLFADTHLPVLERIIDRLVTLPMGPSLSDEQIGHVGESVTAALA